MAKQGIARPEHTKDQKAFHTERPISKAYKALDNDLARDNLENDMTQADLRDL